MKKKSKVQPVLKPKVVMLALEKLVPSADNQRGPMTEASLRPLARSLAKQGCLQPVVVRSHPSEAGKFEIRAGERRWRAAKLAGLKELPAIIRKDDDEAALAVTVVENLQRENPHPLREALTIQQALDRGFDLKALSAKTGHSERYLAQRASLSNLAPVWQEQVLQAESECSRLSVAHLQLIARLPQESQVSLAEEGSVFRGGFPSVEALRRCIDGSLRSLAAMPWKVEDEILEPVAGSCEVCPKRSSRHPLLFADEPQGNSPKAGRPNDRCLDPACFERKLAAYVLRRRDELSAQHSGLTLVKLTYRGLPEPLESAIGDQVKTLQPNDLVKRSDPNAVPVLIVEGPRAGTLGYVSSSEAADSKAATQPRKRPLTMDDRKARLLKRRNVYVVKRVRETLAELSFDKLVLPTGETNPIDPLALVLAFGTHKRMDHIRSGDPWAEYAKLAGSSEHSITAVLEEVRPVWLRRLGAVHHTMVEYQAADAQQLCGLLGLDHARFEKEAALKIPTPKGWAALAGGEGELLPSKRRNARRRR